MTTCKSELRRRVRDIERSWDREYIIMSDRAMSERLAALPEFAGARRVLLYMGVGREPGTLELIRLALDAGKTVALPRVLGGGVMEARQVRDPAELAPGAYSIPEPGEGCALIGPGEFDFILVPGAAFTPEGMRLGRGGGYYDRYLPLTRGVRAAMVREPLIFESLPLEDHDAGVDILVTEERILRPGGLFASKGDIPAHNY